MGFFLFLRTMKAATARAITRRGIKVPRRMAVRLAPSSPVDPPSPPLSVVATEVTVEEEKEDASSLVVDKSPTVLDV